MITRTPTQSIAALITKNASQQTYYTIHFLVDRKRVEDAYRAYAYFRWVDDTLDASTLRPGVTIQARADFLERQKALLEKCCRGESLSDLTPEEDMLVELVQTDRDRNSGLYSYLHNMMKVMEFDAARRGRLISASELNEYTRWLATAVTEAMHYFIGHDSYSPHDETRYLAVSGAHITHMLRDTHDDLQAGYYNVPREVLKANRIAPGDIRSDAYRSWVQNRVRLARQSFQAGRAYLARVENPRCRLAGVAYTARFEWLLDMIEKEEFFLRPHYSERKKLRSGLHMAWNILSSATELRRARPLRQPVISHSLRKT
ncbi:MAG TPA: squalene/phytoene synthase family protein [Anaerolineales bacterium]|nr:squalene/phytoene synthase family protein [Anaerolineales bacterium]